MQRSRNAVERYCKPLGVWTSRASELTIIRSATPRPPTTCKRSGWFAEFLRRAPHLAHKNESNASARMKQTLTRPMCTSHHHEAWAHLFARKRSRQRAASKQKAPRWLLALARAWASCPYTHNLYMAEASRRKQNSDTWTHAVLRWKPSYIAPPHNAHCASRQLERRLPEYRQRMSLGETKAAMSLNTC